MRRSCAVALLAAQACVAGAQPPHLPDDTLPPTTSSALSPSVRFGRLTLVLEETTLAQFRDQVGVGTIRHAGDAGSAERWLCYALGAGPRGPRVWLWSGEVHGDMIGGVTLSSSMPEANCPSLPARFKPVQLQDRLVLGSTSHQVIDLLGRPGGAHAGWWLYGQEDRAPSQDLDRLRYFGAHVTRGKVDELFVSQTTTR